MKRGKLCGSLLICAALVFFCGMTLEGAGFSPALNVQIGERGDTVEVSLPYDGTLGPVAAFRVQVEYDPEALEYLRPSFGETVAMGTTTTVADDGLIQSVFTASDGGSCLTQWEETIIYQFRVREEAVGGLQSISVSVFEIASPDAHFLGNDRSETLQFTIPDPPSSDARLYSLQPETGELDPTFSPDCLSYFVTVPYDVTTMTFQAEAAEGAIFRVNRKNLGSGGSDTVFQIIVTAEDGETKLIYQVTVHREEKEEDPESADARLLSLIPAVGTLSPAFSPDILSYTLTVPYEVTTMTFTAEAAEGARFWVNRKNLGAGGSDTLFQITVTAEDDETKQIYEVTVHRNEKEEDPESADARLLSLIPAAGTLSPAFSPDILSYTLTVPYEVTTMTFTAEAAEGARFWVNRKNLGSGGSDTLFQITVTAEDDETKQIYEVTVHRNEKEEDPESADARLLSLIPATGTLSPTFSPDIFSYTLTVPYEVTTMTFTAEAAEGARFSVNRKNLGSGGSDTLFKVTVTAEDEETKQIYEVTVHRNEKEEGPADSTDARLLSLIPATGTLSPTFSPDILSYTLTVPYEVTTMTFTAEAAEGARFSVNRKNLGSGGSDTLFKITVTAEDDETKQIYEVTVHRNEKEEGPADSTDARLLSLIPATGTLSPTFSPDILSYTLTVPYEVTTMTFTAEAAEGARFSVNRKNLGSGGSDTLFKITVTAEDEETKQIYEVTVHRNEKGSANTASSSSHTSSSGSNESAGSHSSGGSGDTFEEKDTQDAGEKAAESEEKSQAVPVAVVSEPMDGTGGAGELLEGTDASEQISLNEENASVLPGFLVLLGFSLFGFLSGPLSKWLAKRFPDEKSPDEPENPGP